MRNGVLGSALVAVGLSMAIGTAVTTGQGDGSVPQPAGLPDLALRKIGSVTVHPFFTKTGKPVKRRWAVRFTSIVDNLGPGHFVVRARRAKVGSPCVATRAPTNRCEQGNMTGEQLVLNADGTTTTYKKVATVFFHQIHFHWHLRGASRYELRSADGKRRVRRDAKSGFCFGDRVANTEPGGPEYPGLSDGLATCRYGSVSDPSADGRRALEVTEGISVGYGDDYRSFQNGRPLEGQQLEVTGLKAGRYLLVNRTNATGRFREVSKANNASSVLFSLRWPKGPRAKPRIRVLANCGGKAVCKPAAPPVG